MAKAMLYDSSRCIACRGCQMACKQWWELPAVATGNRGTYENPPNLGPETWNKIRFREIEKAGTTRWVFTRHACMHCTDAVCVWVCPSYARTYSPEGYVMIDRERCIGCGRCEEYCPFEVPRVGPHDVTPRISIQLYTPRNVAHKCEWCKDRLESGLTPACVKSCPSGALQFGERADMLQRGRDRVDALKATFPEASLYGESEVGGLHVMYVLTQTPYVHALPEDPQVGEYPAFDADAFPDWYIRALQDGAFPVFPAGAKREWYVQPDLVPTSPLRGAAQPKLKGFFVGRETLAWSWLGVGVVAAGAALAWLYRRRQNSPGAKGENSSVGRGPDRRSRG